MKWFEQTPLLPGWKARKDAPGNFWHRNFVLDGNSFKHHYDPRAVSPNLTHQALLEQGTPLSQIARCFSEQYFDGLAFSRVWINVQGFGEDSAVHRDFERDYDGRSRAAVWYPVPEWQADWGGDFCTFNDSNEIDRAVVIKPNRLVIFDGNPLHAARPISKFCPHRRVAVAFGRERVQ
jgi:hypothetical protein